MNQIQLNQIQTIQSSLRNKLISPYDAIRLIKSSGLLTELEKDPLMWGKTLFPRKLYKPFCNEMHGYFIDIMFEPFTATLAPRGYAKTTIKCFLIPIYLACVYPKKFMHFLNVQNTASKAININLSIREEFEKNPLLIALYGDMTDTVKWTEKRFVLKNGTVFSAISSNEGMRGLNHNSLRPDYCIADDLYDDPDRYNPERIEKINDWYLSSLYPALALPYGDNIPCQHIQGTAFSLKDLMFRHRDNPNWKFKKFQAIKDEYNKIVLWPEGQSYEDLMVEKENLGSRIFAREKQNDIIDSENSVITAKDIRHWVILPTDKFEKTCISVDAAFDGKKTTKAKRGSDYVVIGAWGRIGSSYYLIDQIRGQWDFMKTRRMLLEFCEKHPDIVKKIIEKKANGDAIINSLEEIIDGIMPYSPKEGKVSRFESVSALFEAGNVFFPPKSLGVWVDDLVEEFLNFPNPTMPDDQVDCCSQALIYLKSKKTYKFVL